MLFFKRPMKLEYCVLILVFQIICYIMNTFIKNVFIYAGLHFFMFFMLYQLSLGLHASTLFTLVLIALCIIDFNFWKKNLTARALPPSLSMVLLFFITNIHGMLGLSLALSNYSFNAGIIYITLYLFRLYLINIGTFNNTNDNHIPVKRIINLNTKIVCAIILLLFFFTMFFQSKIIEGFITQLLTTIGLFFKRIISFLLSLFPNTVPEDFEMPPIELPSYPPGTYPAPEESLLNKIFYLLGILYQYLVGIAIVGFFIFIICRFIIKHFHREQQDVKQDSETDVLEIREKIKHKKNITKDKSFIRKSINEKIRYLYKKRMYKLHIQGYKIQTSHTPLERNEDIFKSTDTNLTDLTHFYNAARYGNEPLNEKQFTQAKKSK